MPSKAGAVLACNLKDHTMFTTSRHLILATTIAAALPLGAALAQTATPTTPATATAATPTAQKLSIRDIYDRVEAAGYHDQHEIDFEHGRYEVKAVNAQGQRVKLTLNAQTGVIEDTRVKHAK